MKAIALKLKQLRTELYGNYGRVAKECGFSRVTVGSVLNGDYINQKVIEAAIKVRDQIREEKRQKLEKLASKI